MAKLANNIESCSRNSDLVSVKIDFMYKLFIRIFNKKLL